MNGENVVFSLNKTKDMIEQTAKHRSIDLFRPAKLTSQPEKKPPASPPIPIHIMLKPRSFCASPGIRLWTQVGSQENIAHSPINMVPNISEPTKSSRRFSAEYHNDCFCPTALPCLCSSHLSDSLITAIPISASNTGMAPTKKPSLHEETTKLISPAEKIPTGKAIEIIPVTTALLFSGHTSLNKVKETTRTPPTPNPLMKRHKTRPVQVGMSPVSTVNMP